MDYYYTMRSLVPEFFTNRDPFSPEIQAILQQGCVFPLSKTENAGSPRILVFRWNKCDPSINTVVEITKVFFMAIDILMKEDDNCMIAGLHIVADYKNFNAGYILQLNPNYLKRCLMCLQSAYPIRIKGMYVCNAPSIFETIFNMMKALLSEKLKERFFLYSEQNFEKFCKHVPRSLLPKEYGGKNGSVDEIAAEWKQKLESYRDWFIEDDKYRTQEHLRYGQPYTTSNVFSVEGTFRKLAID